MKIRKHFLMKELTRDSETVGLLQGQVNEVRPSFVDDIVVTNHLSSLLSQGDHTLLVSDAASPVAVSDPDESFGDIYISATSLSSS